MRVPGSTDLDDPSPPLVASNHRVEVARRVRRIRHRRRLTFSGLAVAIVFGATFAAVSLRTPAPTTNALGAASGSDNQMFWPTVGSPDPGSAPPMLSPLGPSTGAPNDQANATTGTGSGLGTGSPNSASSLPGSHRRRPWRRAPIPPGRVGSTAVRPPSPGTESGRGGQCSGQETTPPCGPGPWSAPTTPIPSQLSAMAGSSSMVAGGTRTSASPTNGPDLWGWMRLGPGGRLRFTGPDGTIGFTS